MTPSKIFFTNMTETNFGAKARKPSLDSGLPQIIIIGTLQNEEDCLTTDGKAFPQRILHPNDRMSVQDLTEFCSKHII